ncbi:F0F1 ATP synthase subunit delta [Atopobium fossor]|uniref:F0F1 ATP synthase subunit delta n=1 Tax=Atopobium fossor TaxID=39487 RepID=UPI0004031F8D|nr:F0F1 ATP synthase subunit delta [Atopobium fossor]
MSSTPQTNKAEQYARALIEAAQKEGRANTDLVQVNHALKFLPEVLETLASMHNNNDMELLDSVAQEYKNILDNETDIVQVTATTTVAMDDQLRKAIRTKLEREFNASIYLCERIDPSILGGIVLEIRGNRYDASVRAQLANIRKSLAATYIGSDEQ